MKQIAVVADTTPATKSAYGTRSGGLLPFRGDSALFVDPNSLSMLVIDPAGKIARIMAAPRANDVIFLLGGPQGNPGFDAKGRLVYRAQSFGPPRGGVAGQPMQPPVIPDSVPLVRYDLLTRKLDTAAFVRSPAPKFNVVQNERGVSMTHDHQPAARGRRLGHPPRRHDRDSSQGLSRRLRRRERTEDVGAEDSLRLAAPHRFRQDRPSSTPRRRACTRARAAGPGGGFVITREGPGGNDVVAGGAPAAVPAAARR